MFSRIARSWPLFILGLLLLSACSSGGGDTTGGGNGFDLRITTDKTSGESPLTISFFVTPSGGVAPYTYAWDFNNDGVVDSNAPSAQFTYLASSIARVTVTDNTGRQMTASQSIIVTPPGTGGGGQEPAELQVRFNVSPQVGNVPFDAQFNAVVTGGRQPYEYAWDFEGDGTFDAFNASPRFTFTRVGQNLGNGRYVFYPVLRITDARGVVATNLDDKDQNGQPDFRLEINALPPDQSLFVTATANPQAGQAPLTVEFTAAVAGASEDVEYRWNFGDGAQSAFLETSITTHTYDNAGQFNVTVTARDNETGLVATSAPLQINATEDQPFDVDVTADVTTGTVPFVVNFEANPVNGQEPIQYEWNVFDNDPGNPNPDPQNPPSLTPRAVVTPSLSRKKDPTIHFGNTGDTPNAAFEYRVRVIATDARGNQVVSDFQVITALPHPQPGPQGPGFYSAERPLVVDSTWFPNAGYAGRFGSVPGDPQATANAAFLSDIPNVNIPPQEWAPRANAAVTSHPAGVTFIIGGEQLTESGQFQGLVSRGDSNYAYVPTQLQSHDGGTAYGKYNQNGGLVVLNDGLSPPFPGNTGEGGWAPSPDDPLGRFDTVVPPQRDQQQPPATPGDLTKTQRSTPFTIVGSAQAVFMHESPETNDEDSYPGSGTPFPMGGDDEDFLGPGWYPWPDSVNHNWNMDEPMTFGGLGVPVIYVLGGRTGANSPVDLIQKYYPYGFGTEDMVPYSQDFRFQTTGNQADTWSNYFLRPDQDQFPGSGRNFDPQVQQRTPGNGQVPDLPTLPRPLYGHMAVRVESGIDAVGPTFPNSPYDYIFVMGGIDENNAVRSELLFWDVTIGQEPGDELGEDGLFEELAEMPTRRAYGQALFIPGNPMRIAVIGGFDQANRPLDTVDIYTFDSPFNPVQGSWNTFGGTLEEALRTTAAGYHPGIAGEPFIASFGGFGEADFSYRSRTARLGSGLVVTEPLVVVPRGFANLGQGGPGNLDLSRNRYTIVGGTTEQGTSNIVEVVSLPYGG
jgi:PKD repeat protein